MTTQHNNKEVRETVLAFLDAMNKEDYELAQTYTNSDLVFEGVMGSRNGSENYFSDMKKMKFKYAIDKIFEEGNDICVLYTIDMSGTKIYSCGIYHLKYNRISNIKAIFDPRPLLEKSDEQ